MRLTSLFRDSIKQLLAWAGYDLISQRALRALLASKAHAELLERTMPFLAEMPPPQRSRLIQLLPLCRAQLLQDLFVLSETDFKTNGFFVEFGATDGVYLSNTHLLEKEFGWTGILAEPARHWHSQLQASRVAAVDTDCVWSSSGASVSFNESPSKEYSTIDAFSNIDSHAGKRVEGDRYQVNTVSLLDLLARHNAPRHIDYLSLDTEGSELDILRAFDFTAYRIDIITVEHNFTSSALPLRQLMHANGYIQVHESWSAFDGWFVRPHRDRDETTKQAHP